MTESEITSDGHSRWDLRWPRMLAFVGNAMIYRYRVPGWRGPALLCASVLDVLVYALALSLVLESVFRLDAAERLVPMLIGLIVFRWTMSSAIQASRVAQFAQIGRSHFERPVLATLVLAMGPPTFVFLVSMCLLGGVTVIAVRAPVDALQMLAWGSFAVIVQLLWNSVLVIAIIQTRLRRLLMSEIPIVFGFVLLLIVSPIAYQFSDIPASASRVLTSFNPVAHLIAAYQNAFWYLRDVSMEVLPFSAILAAALLCSVFFLTRNPVSVRVEPDEADAFLLVWNGQRWSPAEPSLLLEPMQIHGEWPSDLPWISGNTFLRLVDSRHGSPETCRHVLRRLAGEREAEQLLDCQLPIMSIKNRSQMCVAAILPQLLAGRTRPANVIALRGGPQPLVVFDGLLDHSGAPAVRALTDIVFFGNAKQFAILTYQDRMAEMLLDTVPNKDILEAAS